jgi:hypothetical protein
VLLQQIVADDVMEIRAETGLSGTKRDFQIACSVEAWRPGEGKLLTCRLVYSAGTGGTKLVSGRSMVKVLE